MTDLCPEETKNLVAALTEIFPSILKDISAFNKGDSPIVQYIRNDPKFESTETNEFETCVRTDTEFHALIAIGVSKLMKLYISKYRCPKIAE